MLRFCIFASPSVFMKEEVKNDSWKNTKVTTSNWQFLTTVCQLAPVLFSGSAQTFFFFWQSRREHTKNLVQLGMGLIHNIELVCNTSLYISKWITAVCKTICTLAQKCWVRFTISVAPCGFVKKKKRFGHFHWKALGPVDIPWSGIVSY